MAVSPGYIIRDGLKTDLAPCLNLDAAYETEYVWQVSLQQEVGLRQAFFKTERLPRMMNVAYPTSEHRLHLALEDDQCFLVAAGRDDSEFILGYLTMRRDPSHQIGFIQDVVVSAPYRRRHIGTRLLRIARQWALEHDLSRVMIETQTKNHPAILFCQSAGFTFCGFNDRYFANQDIAIFFAQALR